MTDRQTHALRLLLLWLLLEVAAAAQVRDASGQSLLATWLAALVRPATWTAESVAVAARRISAGLADGQRLAAENRRLEEALDFSLARESLLEEDLRATRELVEASTLVGNLGWKAVAARCVFRDVSLGSMQVRLSVPSPIGRDTPVVGAGGVVGRVTHSRSMSCWVELITHPAAAIAVQSTNGDVVGLAVGTGGPDLEVRFIPRTATVLVDEPLLSSGADGIYPVGLPVARVTRVRETGAPFLEVRARVSADIPHLRATLLLVDFNRSVAGAAP